MKRLGELTHEVLIVCWRRRLSERLGKKAFGGQGLIPAACSQRRLPGVSAADIEQAISPQLVTLWPNLHYCTSIRAAAETVESVAPEARNGEGDNLGGISVQGMHAVIDTPIRATAAEGLECGDAARVHG